MCIYIYIYINKYTVEEVITGMLNCLEENTEREKYGNMDTSIDIYIYIRIYIYIFMYKKAKFTYISKHQIVALHVKPRPSVGATLAAAYKGPGA